MVLFCLPSYFKPLETSSVVSDLPEFSHTPETTVTNSLSSSGSSPPQQNTTSDTNNNELGNSSVTDSSVSSKTKRAQLKSCIIKLTELSNQERNKWMSGSSQSTSTMMDTDDKSTTSSNSRYNMHARPIPTDNTNRTTGRKRPVVNYSEQGVQDSGRDSDCEAKLKPPQPLDNKSYPSASRITTQCVIESNRAIKQTKQSTLPDETDPSMKYVHGENLQTEMDTLPYETTNPAVLTVPDKTDLPGSMGDVPPDETKDKEASPDVTDGVENEVPMAEPKPGKSGRGVFKTKTIMIRRSRDPRTFKCSVCGNQSPTLQELNALFIQNHRNVNCDICGKAFSMPSSLCKHRYSHIEESEQLQCRMCNK